MAYDTQLALVVPCNNEQEMLPTTIEQLTAALLRLIEKGSIGNGRIIFVDDGSTDNSWNIIKQSAVNNRMISGIKLSHNVGHQNALWAGLERAVAMQADATISIDADLQDDISAIDEMLDAFHHGNDVVFGVRDNRQSDSFLKHFTAHSFYKFMASIGGEIIYNHGDFRLMSLRAMRALMQFPERNMFVRGMVKSIGFPYTCVYYTRKERMAGSSKYPLTKMLNFAFVGITSFSLKPLRFITFLGLAMLVVSTVLIIYGLYRHVTNSTIEGWTSLIISLWFIGGAILTCLGIIGEYIGRIYSEVKHRPRYFIEEQTSDSNLQ